MNNFHKINFNNQQIIFSMILITININIKIIINIINNTNNFNIMMNQYGIRINKLIKMHLEKKINSYQDKVTILLIKIIINKKNKRVNQKIR